MRQSLTKEEKVIYKKAIKEVSKSVLKAEVSKYVTMELLGRTYVLTRINDNRERSGIPSPNFHGTGMALCAVLDPGETVMDYLVHREAMKLVIESRFKNFDKLYKKAWYETNRKNKTTINHN